MTEKIIKISIAVAIIIVGLMISATIIGLNWEKVSVKLHRTQYLSSQQAGEKALNYINKNFLEPQGFSASLGSTSESSEIKEFYKIEINIAGQNYPSYVSKDGKYLFTCDLVNLDENLNSQSENQNQTTGKVEKREKPDVKIFVMSYCPYGLQMEKAFLPVYDLLKDKIDAGIYFVDYIMHEKKELDENLRQYCIEKEEKEKYYTYLSCFVKDGNYQNCLNEAKIDQAKMNNCITQTDQTYKITESYNDKNTWLSGYYPRFDVHKDLNERYGVQGSPTLVINDSIVSPSSRSPEGLKQIICQAFTNPPSECSQTLSTDSASPGFGTGTGSTNSGTCQ